MHGSTVRQAHGRRLTAGEVQRQKEMGKSGDILFFCFFGLSPSYRSAYVDGSLVPLP